MGDNMTNIGPIDIDAVLPSPLDGQVAIELADNVQFGQQSHLIFSIELDDLGADIDAGLKSRGDLETDHWSRRLYWVKTEKIEGRGDHIFIKARLRYEQWQRLPFGGSIRVFRETKSVEISAKPIFKGSDIEMKYSVNIKGLPGFIEKLLIRNFGVPLAGIVDLYKANNGRLEDFEPRIDEYAFSGDATKLQFRFKLSFLMPEDIKDLFVLT